jgi:hypothetical protein
LLDAAGDLLRTFGALVDPAVFVLGGGDGDSDLDSIGDNARVFLFGLAVA